MSLLARQLKNYQDFEIAFFWIYHSDGFTDRSRAIVENEIKFRKLSDNDLRNFVQEKPDITVRKHNYSICPTCTSTKILHTRDMIRKRSESNDAIDGKPPRYQNNYFCSICGWDFNKNKTINDRIREFKLYFIVIAAIVIISVFLSLFMNFVDGV